MTELAVLLGGAAAAYGVSRWTGIHPVPVLVVVGFLLFLPDAMPRAHLEDTLLLGLAVLVFAAGVEMNPRRIGVQARAALGVGIVQFAVLGLAGLGAALLMGLDLVAAAYVGLALTVSSTLVVVRLLQRRQQLFEPFGRLVIGVLLLQDLLVILAIPVLTRLPQGGGAMLEGLGVTLLLVAGALLLHRRLVPALVDRLEMDEEGWLLMSLAVLFLFVGACDATDIPVVVGAFLAGFSLSAFPANTVVRGKLDSLSDFFSALFFTALGAFLVVPSAEELLQALLLAGLVVVVTPLLVVYLAERTGFSARAAITGGLLLAQTSEFSLVVGLQGMVAGQISSVTFTVISLATVMTMTLTPLLTTDGLIWRLVHLHPLWRTPDLGAEGPSGHVLLLGCGTNGKGILELLFAEGWEGVFVVDEDPAVVEELREAGIACLRGDATNPDVLLRAGAPWARVVVSTLRRVEDNQEVLRLARRVPVLVRTFEEWEAEWVRERGGTPIPYAEATAEDFLLWYDEAGSTDTAVPPV